MNNEFRKTYFLRSYTYIVRYVELVDEVALHEHPDGCPARVLVRQLEVYELEAGTGDELRDVRKRKTRGRTA